MKPCNFVNNGDNQKCSLCGRVAIGHKSPLSHCKHPDAVELVAKSVELTEKYDWVPVKQDDSDMWVEVVAQATPKRSGPKCRKCGERVCCITKIFCKPCTMQLHQQKEHRIQDHTNSDGLPQ